MSESVFNEGSVDVDFRVEGNGVTHAFFVEGESDNIAIGTDDPGDYRLRAIATQTNQDCIYAHLYILNIVFIPSINGDKQ